MTFLYKTRSFLTRVINHLHFLTFGRDMGSTMKDFLYHLSWSILGILISSVLLFIANILIGRNLGPNEYGKYNLVSTIAGVLIVIAFSGADTTLVKYVSESDNKQEKNSLLSNALIVLCATSIFITIVVILLRNQLAQVLKVDSLLIIISLILAIIVAFKLQLENFIKARKKFQFQAKMRIIESVLVVSFVSLLVFMFKSQTYTFYIWVSSISAFVIICFYFLKIKKRLRKWDPSVIDKTKKYFSIALPSALTFVVVGNIDKFFISGFMGTTELGIYSAYLTSFNVIVIQLIFAIGNVFFPTVNRIKNKPYIIKKINHMSKIIAIPMILTVSLLTYFVIQFFGSAYKINYLYIILVGIISFLQLVAVFYGATTATSHSLFKQTTKVFYFKPIFLCGLYAYIYFNHQINITSVLFILIASLLYDIANSKFAFHQKARQRL